VGAGVAPQRKYSAQHVAGNQAGGATSIPEPRQRQATVRVRSRWHERASSQYSPFLNTTDCWMSARRARPRAMLVGRHSAAAFFDSVRPPPCTPRSCVVRPSCLSGGPRSHLRAAGNKPLRRAMRTPGARIQTAWPVVQPRLAFYSTLSAASQWATAQQFRLRDASSTWGDLGAWLRRNRRQRGCGSLAQVFLAPAGY
jgi:hypothetical protein